MDNAELNEIFDRATRRLMVPVGAVIVGLFVVFGAGYYAGANTKSRTDTADCQAISSRSIAATTAPS